MRNGKEKGICKAKSELTKDSKEAPDSRDIDQIRRAITVKFQSASIHNHFPPKRNTYRSPASPMNLDQNSHWPISGRTIVTENTIPKNADVSLSPSRQNGAQKIKSCHTSTTIKIVTSQSKHPAYITRASLPPGIPSRPPVFRYPSMTPQCAVRPM